jgi:hypothetical protein
MTFYQKEVRLSWNYFDEDDNLFLARVLSFPGIVGALVVLPPRTTQLLYPSHGPAFFSRHQNCTPRSVAANTLIDAELNTAHVAVQGSFAVIATY